MKKTFAFLLLSTFILFSAFALLDVYYIDVGQADFELIICDGHAMVIDGGNTGDGQLVFSVLKKYVPDGVIDYYIGTHAHEDHMGAAASVLNAVKAKVIYCPNNNANQKFFQNFLKYAENQGVTPTCPSLGLEFSLGGATVKVLGPFHPNASNENNTSIVLKLTYGDTSFLFTGDAEAEEEKELVGKWGDELKSDVIKVGHHGAETSSTYLFLRAVLPSVGIISVGENNKYGHPTEDTLSRYRDADVKLFRTDMNGDIHIQSDGKKLTVSVEKGENAITNPTSQSSTNEVKYIGNKNSKVFHYPTCKNLPAEKNQVSFSTRDEAVDAGYKPCGNCKP